MVVKKKVIRKKVIRTRAGARKSIAKKIAKHKGKKVKRKIPKNIKTMQFSKSEDIARDFAVKVYQKFDTVVKSVVLFGSGAKQNATAASDIDIVILIDDATITWDNETIFWYREELGDILKLNPYQKKLHINTVKITTWWDDLMKGEPTVFNMLRYGKAMIDIGGFFNPLKQLLIQGKIRPSPEAIYNCLERAPMHIRRSKTAELNCIEGLYWSMVESSHAALIAAGRTPPSTEHIKDELIEVFVKNKILKIKYVEWYGRLMELHKGIAHETIHDLKGVEIDMWQERCEEYLLVMTRLVKHLVAQK